MPEAAGGHDAGSSNAGHAGTVGHASHAGTVGHASHAGDIGIDGHDERSLLMNEQDWSGRLSEYEQKQLAAIEKWKEEKPGMISSALGSFIHPAASMVQVVIPDAIVRSAMEACAVGARFTAGSGSDILKEAGLSSFDELKTAELEKCDRLASYVQHWSVGHGAVEGMTTGVAGMAGLIADIPAIITLSMRTIYRTAMCYGYEIKTYRDNEFLMAVMAVAAANTMDEKKDALDQMQKIMLQEKDADLLAKDEEPDFMSSDAASVGFKTLARQLGINLAKRKALQAIPFVGAGVGAAVNAWFIKEISQAAMNSYKDRWLFERYEA